MRRMYSQKEILALVSALIGTSLKIGDYINDGNGKFVWVESIPEDYSGTDIYFDIDQIGIYNYTNGKEVSSTILDINYGVNKLNFEQLTHSFNELDPVLKQIVDDAIADGGANGVACFQSQWKVIKALLDKSLYINHFGYSMVKIFTDGLYNYLFGGMGISLIGEQIELKFNNEDERLYAIFSEV